jgi:hypothetical protein
VSEAQAKRRAALDKAGPFVTNDPADLRWLICGRGRPVSAGSAPYAVEVTEAAARVWHQDIERSRVETEERWEELAYEAVPYAWYAPAASGVRLSSGIRSRAGRTVASPGVANTSRPL